MKCPACKDVDLIVTEHRGMEIERCPMCCGIWFDRGSQGMESAGGRSRPQRIGGSSLLRDPVASIEPELTPKARPEFRRVLPRELGPPKGPST